MRRAALLPLGLLFTACGSADPAVTSPTPRPTAPPITEPPAASCPAGAWCWVRGRPMTIGGDRAAATAYAIGPEGAFLRWDGAIGGWIAAPVPTRHALISAWVGAPDDAWASDSGGTAWHLRGATWTEAPADAPIQRVVGAPDGTVWAEAGASAGAHGASEGGRLLRRDGEAWVEAMTPHPWCLGGAYLVLGGGEVWSAGLTCDSSGGVDAAEVRRYDGAAWQLVGAPIDRQGWYPRLEKIGDRILMQASGLFEWDGTTWLPVARPLPPQQLPFTEQALWDGFDYVTVSRSLGCEAAFRLDDTRVWCSGEGQIYTSDRGTWRPTIADAFAETRLAAEWGTLPPALWAGGDTQRAWGASASDAYRIVGEGRLERQFSGRWITIRDGGVQDVDGAAAGDVWLVTDDGPMHFEGHTFVERAVPDTLATQPVTRVRALGQGRAAALTEDKILVYDDAWSVAYTVPDRWVLIDVAGTSASDLWVVRHESGRSNTVAIEHFDGAAWSTVEVPDASVFGELATHDGQAWLSSDGIITRLDAPATPIAAEWRAFGASLWVDDAAIWLTTARQAARFTR